MKSTQRNSKQKRAFRLNPIEVNIPDDSWMPASYMCMSQWFSPPELGKMRRSYGLLVCGKTIWVNRKIIKPLIGRGGHHKRASMLISNMKGNIIKNIKCLFCRTSKMGERKEQCYCLLREGEGKYINLSLKSISKSQS